jgi:hypothetical protein
LGTNAIGDVACGEEVAANTVGVLGKVGVTSDEKVAAFDKA